MPVDPRIKKAELGGLTDESQPQLHLGVQDLPELHEHCLKVNKQANEHKKEKLGVVNTHGRRPPRQPWETDIDALILLNFQGTLSRPGTMR